MQGLKRRPKCFLFRDERCQNARCQCLEAVYCQSNHSRVHIYAPLLVYQNAKDIIIGDKLNQKANNTVIEKFVQEHRNICADEVKLT